MAHRLDLSPPAFGMPHVWNVSEHVGDETSCPNRPTDVRLVQILLAEFVRVTQPPFIHPVLRTPFSVNGQMDHATAYWIRFLNASVHGATLTPNRQGIISPARGRQFGGGRTWTIIHLNAEIHRRNPSVWGGLPSHSSVNAALRAELQSGAPRP